MQAKTGPLSEEKVTAFGMLSPSTGVAALQALLSDLTSAATPNAAGIRGAATQTYWRLLATKFKPLPYLFTEIDMQLDGAATVCLYLCVSQCSFEHII